MRRFRFRLDGLLRLRSQMERAAQRDLAMAAADVAAVEEHMRLLQQGLSECDEQSRGSGAVAMLSRTMADGLQRQRLRLGNDLRGAQARLDRVVVLIASNMVAEVCSLYLRRRDDSLELVATEGLAGASLLAGRRR